MLKQNNIEQISLEIANYWTSNDFLTESNDRCGTLVALDWADGYLSEINTNIDLEELELKNFKFDVFVDFLKNNNFNHVLGLRNVAFEDNPSEEWTDKLKEILKSNDIDYDEYMVQAWPSPISEFDVPDNVFILRYSYDDYSHIDKFAAHNFLFKDFMTNSEWKKYYKDIVYKEKTRVIVLCSDIENLILHESYDK